MIEVIDDNDRNNSILIVLVDVYNEYFLGEQIDMKALLIDASEQHISEIDIESEAAIPAVIGFDTLEVDEVSPGHKLYFDEECFLRGSKGKFQLDKLIPISGKAVIFGLAGDSLTDASLTIAELEARVCYL
ncbi:MAG: hypothetical protein ACJAYE_000474 [Candidatus Azotimanducaceae bacterium]